MTCAPSYRHSCVAAKRMCAAHGARVWHEARACGPADDEPKRNAAGMYVNPSCHRAETSVCHIQHVRVAHRLTKALSTVNQNLTRGSCALVASFMFAWITDHADVS